MDGWREGEAGIVRSEQGRVMGGTSRERKRERQRAR